MIERLFCVLAAIVGIGYVNASAQEHLSLEDCRKLAIENNKSLQIASEQIRLAHYQKKEALMQYFPKVSASATYLHFSDNLHLIGNSSIPSSLTVPGVGTLPIDDKIRDAIYKAGEVDLNNSWLAGVSLTQPIFTGGKIVAYNDLRAYAEDLAELKKETKMTDVIVEVDEAYWQVVSIANKKKLADSYVDLLSKMNSDIEKMEIEGVATRADRLSVNVKLNEAEMAQTKAENGLSLSKMLLCQICGIDITENITLKDENIQNIILEEAKDIPNIDEAISDRTEIKSLALATKIYKKKEKIAFADFLPTAGLSLGYNWTNPNFHDGLQYKFAGMWNAAVQVKVPLNFISSSAKLNAAKVETKISEFELADAKDKLKLQIKQSIYKLNEADKKLIAAQKNSEKADENLRYANIGFEEGVITASEAMTAHTAWISAHSELVDAQIEMKLCKIYLNKSLGRNIE